jgi:tetratricopeptide (TPR) repeat protein
VRGRTVLLVTVLAALLGAVQLGSDALYGAAAAPLAFPHLVPRAVGIAVYGVLAGAGLPFARMTNASAAIDDGRLDVAAPLIASLPSGGARDDLEGRLLEARGDHAGALARFTAAGDIVRAIEAVDRLDASGQLDLARSAQGQLVAQLQRLDDPEGVARADWRLGELDAEIAGERHSLPAARSALADYQAALALEPLSETYLLGAANQALQNGDLVLARRYFANLLADDPASADGQVGAGRAAALSGDLDEARRRLDRARALAPMHPGIPELEREIRTGRTGSNS